MPLKSWLVQSADSKASRAWWIVQEDESRNLHGSARFISIGWRRRGVRLISSA
jgi:hypothetical protein